MAAVAFYSTILAAALARSYAEGAAVADAKEASATDDKGAGTPVDAGSVKDVASSMKGATVLDSKEAGAPSAKGAANCVDSGSVKSVASSMECAAVADSKEAGDAAAKMSVYSRRRWFFQRLGKFYGMRHGRRRQRGWCS